MADQNIAYRLYASIEVDEEESEEKDEEGEDGGGAGGEGERERDGEGDRDGDKFERIEEKHWSGWNRRGLMWTRACVTGDKYSSCRLKGRSLKREVGCLTWSLQLEFAGWVGEKTQLLRLTE